MKRWYVAQLYAGYEEIVRKDILRRIEETGLEDKFGQVVIPSAKVKKLFNASDIDQDQQLFPGYILIEMEKAPETVRIVLQTPRIIRFLGGKEPSALAPKEVERVLAQMRGEVVVASTKASFELDKEVEISEGPFAGFVGVIDKINEEQEKLTVMVSIFGRMTPVELGFDQVKR